MINQLSYLGQEMDDVHLVWLPQVNKYLQFKEPAWKVFVRLAEDMDHDTIARLISSVYGLGRSEAKEFVEDIATNISETLNYTETSGTSELLPLKTESIHTYRVKQYRVGEKFVAIRFPNGYLFNSVHPFLQHLESDEKTEANSKFVFIQEHERFGLLHNDKLVYTGNESMHLIGQFYQHLLSDIHNVAPDNWMTVCHASAVTDGKNTLMVTGPSGTGKSTITGLLAAHGLSFVADDFVAIDAANYAAYPFPTALSVKKGSVELLSNWFNTLPGKDVHTKLRVDKEIRLLPMFTDNEFYQRIYPVKFLIFLVYREGAAFQADKLSASESLKLFFEQSWVSSNPQIIRHFMRWYSNLSCYHLTYSNYQEAIGFFLKLMKEHI